MKTIQDLTGSKLESLKMEIPAIMKKENVPGLSIVLISNGQLTWSEGFGLCNKKTGQPVSPETLFQGLSLTKTMVAYTALKMYEKGIIGLDVPLCSYLPDPYIEGDRNIDLITMRHVLCHTTGFPNGRGKKPLKTMFTPGTKFCYSGEGFIYLQKVIEYITKQPLDIYLKENLLMPMGLHNSSFRWIDEYKLKVIACGHDKSGTPMELYKFKEAHAAGHLYTTPTEYAKFLINVMDYTNTSDFNLEKETKAEMMKPQIKVNRKVSWGLGCGIVEKPDYLSLWQYGSGNGGKNFFVVFPEIKLGMVIFTNGIRGLNVCKKIIHKGYDIAYPGFSYFNPIGLRLFG